MDSKPYDGFSMLIELLYWKSLLKKGFRTSPFVVRRLEGTGQNRGLVSRNRTVFTGFCKGFSVSYLVLDGEKVLYLQV